MKKVSLAVLALAAAGSTASAQVLYNNGPFITSTTTNQAGLAAPAGTGWSEVSNDTGNLTMANTTAGFNANNNIGIQMGDNFKVPTGKIWNITGIKFWGYQTGAIPQSPPFNGVFVKIYSDNPMTNPAAPVVYGDLTTNRFASTSFANVYRCFNSIVPPGCGGAPTVSDTLRPIFVINANVTKSLPAGEYWMQFAYTGTLGSGPWCPTTTIQGQRLSNPNNNSMQYNVTAWVAATDAGQGCAPVAVPTDCTWELQGTETTNCYPDCNGDGVLGLADFGCFQTKFALNDPYADCNGDGVLGLADFGCFQTKFALGCP
jgi:serine protease